MLCLLYTPSVFVHLKIPHIFPNQTKKFKKHILTPNQDVLLIFLKFHNN